MIRVNYLTSMTLRITGGTAKGKIIRSPGGQAVRPTAAKVRQALFNILQARNAGAAWLDLFAGGGTIGWEALSRGAASVVFVEQARPALQVLQRNAAEWPRPEQVQIRPQDALRYLRRPPARPFDIVFVDPPYAAGLYQPALRALAGPGWLHEGSRLVVEIGAHVPSPEVPGGLEALNTYHYGDSVLVLLCKADAEPSSAGGMVDEVE